MVNTMRGWIALACVCVSSATALGQPYIFGTGYEEYTAGTEVMFQEPRFSGSTDGIHIGQTSLAVPYDDAQVVHPTGDWCPGGAAGCLSDPAYEISFAWRDPTDTTTSGVRCTTLSALNLNRPSLHLDGIIRFKMAVTTFSFEGDLDPDFPIGFQDQSGSPSILMCLAITETGRDLPQGTPDTSGGDIEFVYLPLSEVVPVASNGMGTFPPGGKRFAATTDLWPPEDPDFVTVTLNLATLTSGQLRGFVNNGDGTNTAGDGALDATLNPNGHGVNRGALESIIFTNDPADPTGEYFFIYIDDLEFEAPVDDPTPPPTVVSPILRNATTVTVTDISTNATQIKLKVDNGADPDQIVNTTGVTNWVFTLPHGAIAGDEYTATQTIGGVESSDSIGVTVSFPGPFIGRLPKATDTTVRVTDINASASSVKLYVEGVLRSTTPVAGQYQLDVSAGGALVMGEDVHATQVVTGAESDISHTVVVTTNVITPVVCDDFEYANQAAFDAIWQANAGDTQLQLSSTWNASSGGSKSALSDTTGSGVNANQSRRISEFGPLVATDTQPVIWNVSFYDDQVNGGLYRQWAELRSVGGGSNPIIAMGKSNEIAGNFYMYRVFGGGPGAGFFLLNGFQQPQRSIGWHVLTAAIKNSTIDFYVDGNLAAANVSHTAGQQLATAYIGSGLSSAGGNAWYDDVCVETGALNFNTVTAQPPGPPTVVAPILPGAMTVTVNNINTNATAVSLHLNGSDTPVVPPVNPGGSTSVVINLSSAAVGGNYYTAKQTVGGLTSAHSAQVFVLLPGPVMYKAPAQGETSVRVLDVNTNASVVQVVVDNVVRGSVNNPGVDDVIVPVSPPALTMGQVVTARMTVSGIQSVDATPETVTNNAVTGTLLCDNFTSYANQAAFEVTYDAVNYTSSPNETIHVLTTESNATVGGGKSIKSLPLTAQYRTTPTGNPFPGVQGTDTNPAVFNVSIYDPSAAAGADEWASAINWSTLGGGPDFFLAEIGMATNAFSGGAETHYQARLIGNGSLNWFQLNQFDGPTRTIGWHVFTMVFKGPKAGNTTGHEVDIYVDGKLSAKNMLLVDNTNLVTPLIGSGQTSDVGTYYDDYCVELGPVRFNAVAPQPPAKPALVAALEAGDTTVTLTGVGPSTTSITVFANGSPIGTFNDAGTNGTVTVTVSALEHLDAITATQTNAIGTSTLSDPLEVGIGNGDIKVCIGIRETGDAGALGTQGGTTGAIEWISSGAPVSSAPQGEALNPSGGWVTYEFNPTTDPIAAFPGSGNGAITGTRGVLEHLAVTANTASANRSTGAYTMYVDNVINVGAGGGGSNFIIEDFESNAPGVEVLFQEPTFSGTTFPSSLAPLPSASEVTADEASSGTQSAILRWFWKNTAAGRWARITTSGAAFRSRPIIDITKPIRMDILLVENCQSVPGDADGDGDVDRFDIDEIVACLDGPTTALGSGCACADLNGDQDVDLADYADYQDLVP